MAVGFTPKHTGQLSLSDTSQQTFMVAAYQAAIQSEWDVQHISDIGFIAVAGRRFGFRSKITVKIDGDMASVTSESLGSEMADLGRNKKRIRCRPQRL